MAAVNRMMPSPVGSPWSDGVDRQLADALAGEHVSTITLRQQMAACKPATVTIGSAHCAAHGGNDRARGQALRRAVVMLLGAERLEHRRAGEPGHQRHTS